MSRFSHIIRKIIRDIAIVDLGWKYKNSKGKWVYVGEDESKIPKYAKDQKVETRKKKVPTEKPVKKTTNKKSPMKKTKQTTLPEEPSIPKQDSYTADEVRSITGKEVDPGEYVKISVHPMTLDPNIPRGGGYSSPKTLVFDPTKISPIGEEVFASKDVAQNLWEESHEYEAQDYYRKYADKYGIEYTESNGKIYTPDNKFYGISTHEIERIAERRGENNWKFSGNYDDKSSPISTNIKDLAHNAIKEYFGKINDDTIDENDEYIYALATKQHPSHMDHPVMTYIADQLGFHAPPKVISNDEFDKMNSDTHSITLRRGVGGASIPGFIGGTNKIQRYGIYGSGCYNMVCQVDEIMDPRAEGLDNTTHVEYGRRLSSAESDLDDYLIEEVKVYNSKKGLPFYINVGKDLISQFEKCRKQKISFDEAYDKVRKVFHDQYGKDDWNNTDLLNDGMLREHGNLTTFGTFFTGLNDSHEPENGYDVEEMKTLYAGDGKAIRSKRPISSGYKIYRYPHEKAAYESADDAKKYKNFIQNMKDLTQIFADQYDTIKNDTFTADAYIDKEFTDLPEETRKLLKDAYKKQYAYEILSWRDKKDLERTSIRSEVWNKIPKIKVKLADKAERAAALYANAAKKEGKEGFIMKLAVDPSAKLTTYDKIKKEKIDLDDLGITDPMDRKLLNIMMNRDPGLKAMLLGYDGYYVDKSYTDLEEVDYMLMFNRSKLMIVDPREGKNE